MAVTKTDGQLTSSVLLPEIRTGDRLIIYDGELIPVDGLITRGNAHIDYSFVTGESKLLRIKNTDKVFAGGRIEGAAIEMTASGLVQQSYLTELWSRSIVRPKPESDQASFVQLLSRYFTIILFGIASAGAVFWLIYDASKVLHVVTSVLIVACPCALLLSNSFTNSFILNILGVNKLYLRSPQVIEDIANADHLVFDKTGTLTSITRNDVIYHGKSLTESQESALASLASQSGHPVSRAISWKYRFRRQVEVSELSVHPGAGVSAIVDGQQLRLGKYEHVHGDASVKHVNGTFISFNGGIPGYFELKTKYRNAVSPVLKNLTNEYPVSVISGDGDSDLHRLRALLGNSAKIRFNLSPVGKLKFIRRRQLDGERIIMIGDGLNDAGALLESTVGIAITEDRKKFTPASDAILDASAFHLLPAFLRLCKVNKKIVQASFIVSLTYNIAGLGIALQGKLYPMIAAILMPASTLSIILI
ncbi:MAG: HAD family hydrolase, partial [Chitinophagaceae bacterium]